MCNKKYLKTALSEFSSGGFYDSSLRLFNTLGYKSNRILPTSPGNSPKDFLNLIKGDQGNADYKENELFFDEWEKFAAFFQYTSCELKEFIPKCLSDEEIQSFIFISIGLKGHYYFEYVLETIARNINKLFPIPVIILYSFDNYLSLFLVDRRINLKNNERDVFEKIYSINSINIKHPKNNVINVLHDLSVPSIICKYKIESIRDIYKSWLKILESHKLSLPEKRKEYDGLKRYLNDIRSNSKSTAEEDRIVADNLRLVAYIVINNFYKSNYNDLQDLITVGYQGLLNAIEKYDPNKNTKFSTYASFWISQNVKRYVINNLSSIRIPVQTNDKANRINKEIEIYFQDNNSLPSLEQISEITGYSIRTIKGVLTLTHNHVYRYSGALNLSHEYSFLPFVLSVPISDNDEAQCEPNYDKLIGDIENCCTKREADVLFMRYGLNGYKEETLENITEHILLTRERIRQIEVEALKKLRNNLCQDSEYLEVRSMYIKYHSPDLKALPEVMTCKKFFSELTLEIYQIIEDNRVEMTMDELVSEFKIRFPKVQFIEKHFTSILKKKIFRRRTVPGRIKLYSLEEWYQ